MKGLNEAAVKIPAVPCGRGADYTSCCAELSLAAAGLQKAVHGVDRPGRCGETLCAWMPGFARK